MTRYQRHSARVIVLDAQERVLLFRHIGSTVSWITPGGGRHRWEPLSWAAARELREETGLRVPARRLGAQVAYAEGYAYPGGLGGLYRDDYFAHQVTAHTVDTSGFTEHERVAMAVHRWWPLAELTASGERVHPVGLADFAARLLTGWRPAAPVRLVRAYRDGSVDPDPAAGPESGLDPAAT
jgi:8-oxo-dGTP pyrophosphatase MutT (NUDIX family)